VPRWPFQPLASKPDLSAGLRGASDSDPALFTELLCNITQPTTSLEGDDEPAYADTFDDPSDIPVDVIEQHVVSGISIVTGGFLIDDDGCLSIPLLLRS